MDINQNHLSRIRVFVSMLLFVMCLTMNMLFCSTYNFYELSDETTVTEKGVISESITANEDGGNTTYFETSFLSSNDSYHEIIKKNLCSILVFAAVPKGISQLLFLTIVFLYFFLNLYILLPDGWTLINRKVRQDN